MIFKNRVQETVTWCLEHPARLFFICACLIALDHFILGPFSYLKWHDLGELTFTRYVALSETVGKFGVYYWFPYAGSGVDILSNGFRFFDVFFVAFKALPYWLVIPVFRIIQIFIAGWFTYRLCSERLGLSREASLAAGLFYALLQGNSMEHYFGAGAIPLLVLYLEKLHESRGIRVWAMSAGLGAAYSLLVPAHLTVPYIIPAMFVWLFFVRGLMDVRLIGLMTVFGAFSVLLQLDLLLAMVINMPLSQRAAWNLDDPYFDRFIFFLLESLWNYLPLIILCFAGAFLNRGRDRSLLILLGLIVAIFVISSFGIPLRRLLGTVIPLLKSFTIARFTDFLPFFLSIGGAWGLHEISRKIKSQKDIPPRRISWNNAIYSAALLLVALHPINAVAGNIRDWVQWGSYTNIYRSPNIERVADEFRSSDVPFRVGVIQENGLQAGFAHAYGIETVDGYLNMYPNRYHRFWSMVIEPFLSRHDGARAYFNNYGLRISLLTDDGHPLPLDVSDYFRMNLLSLANMRYILTTVPLNAPGLELLEETRPERFWDELSTREKIRARLKENFSGRDVMVYRNRSALPRWFLAGGVDFYENEDELKSKMADTPAQALAQTALFEKSHAGNFKDIEALGTPGSIQPEIYSPDRIRLKVTAKGNTVLIVSNTYSPFWRVRVNGREKDILPAYGTFWGVALKAGTHTVEFRYQPPYRLVSR